MDTRRNNRYNKQQDRFKKHRPRTRKDTSGPRVIPAENYGGGGKRNRKQNSRIAEMTVEMLEGTRRYSTKDGVDVDISTQVAAAIANTVTYSPDTGVPNVKITNKHDTEFEVERETTLAAAERLYNEYPGKRIGVLNFASAKNPGGGFLNGSMAQEESLASSSALYACIERSPMYDANTQDPNRGLYQHYMICSPDVPVFRDEDADYIEEPYPITFLTVPAVNVGSARKKDVCGDEIKDTMRERIDRMFAMAVWHKVDVLVLGSWGCGVFGGDIRMVANLFIKMLTEKYEGAFEAISFSTLDQSHIEVFEGELEHTFR